jgi:hypothetical protein
MSEGRPRLVAVGGEGRGPAHPGPAREKRRSRDLGRWLLVGACIVLLLGLLHELHQSRRLAAELSQSRSDLRAARAALAATNARIDEARSRTRALSAEASALAGRLEELDGLLAPPAAAPAAPPAAPTRPPASTAPTLP